MKRSVVVFVTLGLVTCILGCSGTSQSSGTSQPPLEAAAESCDVRSGVDAVGNFYDTKSTWDLRNDDMDKMEPEWICLIRTLAGESVLRTLLAEQGEDFRTITTNGYTFSFSWLGWTYQKSELYIVSS